MNGCVYVCTMYIYRYVCIYIYVCVCSIYECLCVCMYNDCVHRALRSGVRSAGGCACRFGRAAPCEQTVKPADVSAAPWQPNGKCSRGLPRTSELARSSSSDDRRSSTFAISVSCRSWRRRCLSSAADRTPSWPQLNEPSWTIGSGGAQCCTARLQVRPNVPGR
jgi:hypothetical protein